MVQHQMALFFKANDLRMHRAYMIFDRYPDRSLVNTFDLFQSYMYMYVQNSPFVNQPNFKLFACIVRVQAHASACARVRAHAHY